MINLPNAKRDSLVVSYRRFKMSVLNNKAKFNDQVCVKLMSYHNVGAGGVSILGNTSNEAGPINENQMKRLLQAFQRVAHLN